MTFREKLADLLTGGSYRLLMTAAGNATANLMTRNAQLGEAKAALGDIAAMETPNCAHIGKRMARRAREALDG